MVERMRNVGVWAAWSYAWCNECMRVPLVERSVTVAGPLSSPWLMRMCTEDTRLSSRTMSHTGQAKRRKQRAAGSRQQAAGMYELTTATAERRLSQKKGVYNVTRALPLDLPTVA